MSAPIVSSISRIVNLLPLAILAGSLPVLHAEEDFRTRLGLSILYEFNEEQGADVKDTAQAGAPIDLKVPDETRIRRSQGTLILTGPTTIRSSSSASRFTNAVRRSGECSVELWIDPSKPDQEGPARILTISKSSTERNLTIGQEKDTVDVRCRTTQTSPNGLPSLAGPKKSLPMELSHVVYTRDRSGRARIYINGDQVTDKRIEGSTQNWVGAHELALGNELNGSRPWVGTYHLVALYHRSLNPNEIRRHHALGPNAPTAPFEPDETAALDPTAKLFNESIAPILAKHCLECHDASNRKGRLNLAHRDAAMKGGSEGPSIIPGKADESLLWELVRFDDMPEDRSPLSDEEKALLKQWIDGGASWPTEQVDPLAHKRDRRAGELWIRRLTLPEYVATVKAAVDVDITADALRVLPEDLRADGFSNTAYNLGVDFEHVEAYAELASIIVENMDIPSFTKRFAQRLRFTDKEMGKFIEQAGKWLLRGPLSDQEVIAYRGISTAVASAGGSQDEAVRYMIEAMLQSPRFIYQVETQRGDGRTWPLSEYELASRMSYILWGASPDRELMRAADAGDLYDSKLVEAQIDRMLDDPRAMVQSERFYADWLHLDRLANMQPNKERFPNWDPSLAEDMKAESLAFFRDLVWEQNRPLKDLLNAQFTYVTPKLAAHYNLDLKDETLNKSGGLQRVSLDSDTARGGLLTQGSVLTIGGDDASMVTRGLFVLHDLLRSGVNDPPPGVDTNPVATEPGLTQRAIAEKRVADRSCGGCHSKFEPLAYGLERFDGLGSFLDKDEHGNTLREDGEILFPGEADPIAYETSSELMDILAESDRVEENFTWKVIQFALGRPLIHADSESVGKIHALAQKGGGTYKSLIKAIVLSDLVRSIRTEPNEEKASS